MFYIPPTLWPTCNSPPLYPYPDFKDLNEDMKQGLGHLAATLEHYLKKEIPDSSMLPPGFQTLDYFCKVSAKSKFIRTLNNAVIFCC